MPLTCIKPLLARLDLRTAQPEEKRVDKVYVSPEWRSFIGALIAKRGRRCENPRCGRTGCRIFGDHIVELKDGGELLDENNIQLLCGSCHTTKTHRARAARMAVSHDAGVA